MSVNLMSKAVGECWMDGLDHNTENCVIVVEARSMYVRQILDIFNLFESDGSI